MRKYGFYFLILFKNFSLMGFSRSEYFRLYLPIISIFSFENIFIYNIFLTINIVINIYYTLM
jgi:hypothetical protein